MTSKRFRERIWYWYRRHGRYDLPWRKTRHPYEILVSEVMLQQTQVSRVIPKYREFLRAFPTLRALDRAPLAKVLRVWQGLGYNRRAKHLQKLAAEVTAKFGGRIPADPGVLRTLPGIGTATAGAISAFAFDARVAFLETNIRRVYLHHFFRSRRNVPDQALLAKIQETLPRRNSRQWYYALMDYGALGLPTVPNPNRRSAHYARQPRFRGSRRELRGQILREIITRGPVTMGMLSRRIAEHPGRRSPALVRNASRILAADGLLKIKRHTLTLP